MRGPLGRCTSQCQVNMNLYLTSGGLLKKKEWLLKWTLPPLGPSDQLSNSAESVMESKCTQTAEDDASNFMSYYYRVFLTP